jgi:hypothetical protein
MGGGASASHENTVIELDIRDRSTADAEGHAAEAVRDFRWRRGSARLVVIDDARSLADHDSIYQTIQAHQGSNVLCIAVGGPASRAAGVALRTTQVLNNQTTATLWVGDPDGVSWPTDVLPASDTPLVTTPQETLRALREILRMPEVFDQVIRLADKLPYRVASPGHLVAAGQVGPAQLAAAQLASVDQVAGGADPAARPMGQDALVTDYWPLITTERPATDVDPTRLRRDSPLGAVQHDAGTLLQAARTEASEVDGRFGPRLTAPPSPVLDRTVAAGEKVAEFQRGVHDLFGRVDVREGLSHAARDRLTHAGIDMRDLDDATHRDIATRLRELVLARFQQGLSLRDAAELGREIAEHAAPAGSRGRLSELDAACPDDLIARLTTPPPFPWSLVTPWVLAVVTVCGLLAGLTPAGLIAGIVVALGWSAVVFAADTRRPTVGQRPIRFDPMVLTHLGAVVVGAIGGVAIADALRLPAWLGWVCLLGPVVGLPLALRRWWWRASDSWGLTELLDAGQQAHAAVLRLLCQVVVGDWVANDARRFLARGAFEIATALDAVGGALGEWVPVARPGSPVEGRTSAGEQLQNLITEDIRHVVGRALEGSWHALEAGTFADVGDGVRQRTLELLDGYSRHLENVGIDQPFQPDVGTPPAPRTQLVRTLWQQSTEINWLMYDAGADSPMIQLCGPEDVFLLDGARENFGLVRFAPRAAREPVTAVRPTGQPDVEITWTGAGHIAGVLRLVPLRSTAVESDWSTSTHETDIYQ